MVPHYYRNTGIFIKLGGREVERVMDRGSALLWDTGIFYKVMGGEVNRVMDCGSRIWLPCACHATYIMFSIQK